MCLSENTATKATNNSETLDVYCEDESQDLIVLHCVDIALNDLSKQLKCNCHEILLEMCFL